MSAPRTLVVGDLHLSQHSRPELAADFARLLAEHPGARVLATGDVFDLAGEAPTGDRTQAAIALMDRWPEIRAAIGHHLDGGGEILFFAGNHDAEVGDTIGARPGKTPLIEELARAIGLDASARTRLRAVPWFWREGGLHVEHGHCYDPDNTPVHPLIRGTRALGCHFSAEFLHPTGAYRFLQETEATPLDLLRSAYRWYGVRMPWVLYRYFYAAFGALFGSGPFFRAGDASREGERLAARYAADAGVSESLVAELAALRARPTLESFAGTFARLYMDRVTAMVALTAGMAAAAGGAPQSGAAMAGVGGMLMTLSWVHRHNRYTGSVSENLRSGAERIRATTGARCVLFGHTHIEALEDGYANTGSFAFHGRAPGRPYLEMSGSFEQPVAERRYLL